MKRRIATLWLMTCPVPAAAHDAFGDLGPFYESLLHPLVDPVQGLLLVAVALLLARQPLGTVRPAYAALAGGGLAVLLATSFAVVPTPGPLVVLVVTMFAALAVLAGLRPGAVLASVLAALLGGLAALSFDPVLDGRTALLTILGGATSISLLTLFAWGAGEWADRRLSPYATSVAASWVAAIALMTAVVPV